MASTFEEEFENLTSLVRSMVAENQSLRLKIANLEEQLQRNASLKQHDEKPLLADKDDRFRMLHLTF